MHRRIVAFALVYGIAAAICAPAQATVPAFTVRNTTGDLVYVEVLQKTPFQRLTRLYVNPRRTESQYFTTPLGQFEVLVTVHFGKHKIVLPPKEMIVRTGNEGHIIISYVTSAHDPEALDFAVDIVSAP